MLILFFFLTKMIILSEYVLYYYNFYLKIISTNKAKKSGKGKSLSFFFSFYQNALEVR